MNKNNKWFWAFIGVAVALVIAIVVAVIGFVGQEPSATTPEIEEGAETGLYYYNSDNGEYTLHLHSGNQFTLNDGVAKVGEYTVSEGNISFTFKKESNGSATAKIDGDAIVLTYNGEEIRFLRKVNYTVTFNSNGGNAVENAVAVNGSPVAKPADPAKEGYYFVGWYVDAELTTPYVFGSSIITADTTLYAKWIEKVAGQPEYTISFEGADIEDMTTMGGKLHDVPTPEKEGYTFGGWWISMYEDADKLSYKYSEDMVFDANTTLYAVWVKAEGDKLVAPQVDVNDNGISWTAVNGATTYAVKITAPNGSVAFEDNVSATTKVFDFAVAGGYVIEVTAVASDVANNSDTTYAYYNAKALSRVSVFTVVDSTLVFNGVENAEQYYITVKCGNPEHNHTNLNNGSSTVYNFYNCEMKEGGIEFTVTAKARGYSDSVSKTFVYERKLDKITDLTVKADTEKLVWTPVSNAMFYLVEVTAGGNTTVSYVNTASVDLKGYAAGEISVKVTPVTDGYNSEASEFNYTKATLAAPQNIVVNGTTVTWDAVEGATKYTVKVGSKTFEATATTLDLTTVDLTFVIDDVVEISVKAEGTAESLYSDVVVAQYNAFAGNLIYANGNVSWTPAIGSGYYEVKVNDGEAVVVNNANSYAVKFNKAGINTVAVRYVSDEVTSAWATIDLNVSSIIFDSRQGTGIEPLYFVKGDKVELNVETTRAGYTFSAWYTTPNAANGNGAIYNDVFFTSDDSIVLYAQWTANKYTITYEVESNITGVENGATVEVTFGQSFTLGVPTSDEGAFVGWFSGIGGSGYQLTDSEGVSVINYKAAGNITAYPYFEIGTLEYVENTDGTLSVKAGPAIKKVTNVVIPETYNGKTVTTILENAFAGCSQLKTVSLPDTVTIIGAGAFTTCTSLEAINVREVDGRDDSIFSSYDGALIRKDINATYLELFPRGKSGEYTIPDTVDSIRNKAFQYSYNLTKLNISSNVTYVAEQAFYHCPELQEIVFLGGGEKPLTIEDGAFFDTSVLTSITLPARLATVSISTFDNVKRLATINVEDNGTVFGSVDGMLTNADKDTILYCPNVRKGAVTIPVGVTAIGDGAFAGRNGITSVVISNKVTAIGAGAFEGAVNIASVTFEGGRNTDLAIGANAFAGCTGISTVDFAASATDKVDGGEVEIGAGAFNGCTRLATLNFAATANISVIETAAFKGCNRISSLTIPGSTDYVGDSAFEGCSNINNIEFAEDGLEIEFGKSVFAGCSKLTTIHIPSTLVNFDSSAFAGCNAITTITVAEGNPNYVAEDGILYDKAKTEIMYYPRAKEVDFNKLPATITKICAAAFQGNVTLTEVTIPAAIEVIGDNAFEGCVNLSKLTFAGDAVKDIGAYAFANCPALTEVTLPAAVENIGDYAFYLTALSSINFPAETKTIGAFAFAQTNMAGLITIPAKVSFIGDGAFAYCPSINMVVIEEGTTPLQIGTAGDAETTVGVFQGTDTATYDMLTGKKTYSASFTSLSAVTLADRVTLIGTNAFAGHMYLQTLTFGENSQLKEIHTNAFKLNSIKELNLPEGLEYIGASAFEASRTLASLTIPSTVTSVGVRAFSADFAYTDQKKLTSITFAPGGTADLYVSDYAFYNQYSVTELNLPARLTRIYDMVVVGNNDISVPSFYTLFYSYYSYTYQVNNLATITVEEGGEKFSSVDGILYENDANGNPAKLIWCPGAKTGDVVIPNTVTQVMPGAFYATKLSAITFEEKENWNGIPTLEIGLIGNEGNTGDVSTSTSTTIDYPAYVIGGKTTSLTSIKLPAHLKSVGNLAFWNLPSTCTVEFNLDAAPVAFGYYAFYNTTSSYGITSIKLPKVAQLYESVFSNQNNLTTIEFAVSGSTITEMPAYFVSNSNKLTSIVNVPAGVTAIREHAFSSCGSLSKITFEEGSVLRTIETGALSGTAIKEFVFPETLTTVGSGIFPSSLTKVTLSSNLKTVVAIDGGSIFEGCINLKEIVVPESNPYLKVIDGVLYNSDATVLMYCPPAKTDVTIPDTVHTIEVAAFSRFQGTSITLPAGLIKIGDSAFANSKLTSITIPASVQMIGNKAFMSNSVLAAVTFAENSELASIGSEVFNGCNALTRMEIPDTVTTIGAATFKNCKALEYVDLPTSLTGIGYQMFYQCSALKEVHLYEGIEAIEYNAFKDCRALESIVIPASVESIEDTYFFGAAFEGCISLKSVIFAEGSRLDYLAANTFKGCEALETVVLPEKLTVLSTTVNENTGKIESIFNGCVNLKEVTLGNVEVIPEGFFAGFDKLETVVLPNTLVEIGANAFNGCTSLKNITIPETVEIFGDGAFQGCVNITTVNFGEDLSYIGAYAFDGCTGLTTVKFNENCTITALGSNPDVEYAAFRGTTALKEIVIPNTVTIIGANIFQNSGIESFVIPENLTAISDYAFAGTKISEINVPETVRSIGNFAFADCALIENMDLPFGVESIGSAAFLNCVSLRTLKIPATVNNIAGNPFVNCPALAFELDEANTDYILDNGALLDAAKTTLVCYSPAATAETYEIPSTVYWLSEGAFYGSQLKSITLPDVMTEIPAMLFMGSTKLETVVVPKSVKSIGKQAFEGCTSLKNFTVHETVTYIAEYAFANSGVETVKFADRNSEYTIASRAFDGCMNLTTLELAPGLTGLTPYMLANTGLVEFTVPEFITNFNVEGVFYGSTKLETIVLPDTAEAKLGYKFFMNCTALKNVDLGAIKELGTSPQCTQMYDVIIPSQSSAFEGCTALETIDLTNITAINERAFYGCTSLVSFTAPKSCYLVAAYAFANCTSLVEANFTSTTIPYYGDSMGAWYGPDYWVGTHAFENCTSLKKVIFPSAGTLKALPNEVFVGCTSMELIEFPKTPNAPALYAASPFKGLSAKTVISFPAASYSTSKNWLATYAPGVGNVIHMNWLNDTDAIFVLKSGAKVLPGFVMVPNGTSTNIEILEYISGTTTRKYTKLSKAYEITLSNNAKINADGTLKSGTVDTNYLEHQDDGTILIKYNGIKLLPGGTIELPNGMKLLPDRTLVLADGTEIPHSLTTAAEIVELLHPTAPVEGEGEAN